MLHPGRDRASRLLLPLLAVSIFACQSSRADSVTPVPPTVVLVNTDVREAHARLVAFASGIDLTALETANDRLQWANSTTETAQWDLDRAVVLRATLTKSRPGRRIRIDLIPHQTAKQVALSAVEECAPELAPIGAPAVWHPCGSPRSTAFKVVQRSLREDFAAQPSH